MKWKPCNKKHLPILKNKNSQIQALVYKYSNIQNWKSTYSFQITCNQNKTTLHLCRNSLHPVSFYSPFCRRPKTGWRSCSGVDSRRGAPVPSPRHQGSDSRSETAGNRSRFHTHSMITETNWCTFLRSISNEIHILFNHKVKNDNTISPIDFVFFC